MISTTTVTVNRKRSLGDKQKARLWKDQVSFDNGNIVQLINDHKSDLLSHVVMTNDDESGSRQSYSFNLESPLPSLKLIDNGTLYSIAEDRIHDFEERFGEEPLMESIDQYYEALSGYFDPAMDKRQILQWIVLWIISYKNEFVLSGILGEQKLTQYSLVVDDRHNHLSTTQGTTAATAVAATTDTATRAEQIVNGAKCLVLQSSTNCEDSSSTLDHNNICNFTGYSPTSFSVLHRDSSGECVCHGECAVFINIEDECAELIHKETGLPLYMIPLAYGCYSMGMPLSWKTPIDNVQVMAEWMNELQRVMKKDTARDHILRH